MFQTMSTAVRLLKILMAGSAILNSLDIIQTSNSSFSDWSTSMSQRNYLGWMADQMRMAVGMGEEVGLEG